MATSALSSLSQSGHAGWRVNVARPTKGKSIRSSVLRLVLSVVIAMSFPPTAENGLRWPDSLIVQQITSVKRRDAECMKDFSIASFPPETIDLMKVAMDAAVATLPEPSSAHVQSIAETILRTAKDGERDPAALQRMALLELQITPRD
jgi:hypothetical protein